MRRKDEGKVTIEANQYSLHSTGLDSTEEGPTEFYLPKMDWKLLDWESSKINMHTSLMQTIWSLPVSQISPHLASPCLIHLFLLNCFPLLDTPFCVSNLIWW